MGIGQYTSGDYLEQILAREREIAAEIQEKVGSLARLAHEEAARLKAQEESGAETSETQQGNLVAHIDPEATRGDDAVFTVESHCILPLYLSVIFFYTFLYGEYRLKSLHDGTIFAI